MPYTLPSFNGSNPIKLTATRKDISGGINNRQHETNIKTNACENLINADIGIPGLAVKRAGRDLIEKLGTDPGTSAFGFEPIGQTTQLVVTHGTKLETYPGSGTFTERKTDFTDGLLTSMCKATTSTGDSVLLVCNGTDNFFEFDPTDLSSPTDLGSDSNDPPKTTVFTFYGNRLWTLKNEGLDFSDAAPASYDGSFNNTGFVVPVGKEIAIVGIRDQGLFCVGTLGVYALNPSAVPAADTDKPEKILDIGGAATKTFVQVGDDIYGLFYDGVRAIKRTLQDKLQLGVSYPLSYVLREEIDSINWAAADKASAVWFDNKYLISLPVDGETYNNEVWVYYPANDAWSVWQGWNVADWAKVVINGQEILYGIDSVNGAVYQFLAGTTDDDDSGDPVAISYTEIGRKEDLDATYNKKNTGEVTIRCEATGGDLMVEANFDDSGWNTLGTVELEGNLVTFPITFPVTFLNPNIITKKFHLDPYGAWYNIQLRLTHTDTDELKILERSMRAYLDEYTDEE